MQTVKGGQAANVHDSVGAEEVFESMRYKFPGLKRTKPCCISLP